MDNRILHQIKAILDSHSLSYREVQHQATYTSEESAKARGEDLAIGGKALLLKIGDSFKLFVLSATLKIDSTRIKKHFQVKKLRFASREELEELTGLVPGAVPPFGIPITPFELFVDPSILDNQKIAFNAGSLTDSIIMDVQDYVKLSSPEILSFSLPK